VHFDPVASPESSTVQNHRIPADAFIEQDIDRPLEAPLEHDEEETTPRSREGLPPAFRMRHGRHYVEQLMGDAPLRTVREIALSDIEPPPTDTVNLQELERSIREVGVVEPLLVTQRGKRYRVIAGMNRLRAATKVGLRTVPCLVHDVDDETVNSMRKAASQRAAGQPAVEQPLSPPAVEPELPPAFAEVSAGLTFVSALLPAVSAAGDNRFRTSVLTDLATVELMRARSVAAAAEILSGLSSLARAEIRVGDLIDALQTATRPEARLRDVALDISTSDPDYAIALDAQVVSAALIGLVQSLLAMGSTSDSAVRVRFRGTTIRAALIIEASHDLQLHEVAVRRFFDGEWRDHPGGAAGALMLAAAQRVARLHGGRIDVEARKPQGCTVTFVVPSSTS
jgi:hypothetical protein